MKGADKSDRHFTEQKRGILRRVRLRRRRVLSNHLLILRFVALDLPQQILGLEHVKIIFLETPILLGFRPLQEASSIDYKTRFTELDMENRGVEPLTSRVRS